MTTVPELKDELAARGVDVPADAKKSDLEALLASTSVQPDPVTITDENGNVLSTEEVRATDEDGNPVPVPPDVSPAHAAFASHPDLSDPQAPVHPPVVTEQVEPTPALTVSGSDPAADAMVPVTNEALPDVVDKDFAKAEKLLLDSLRGLLGLGKTRAQLVDAVNVCVDTLYAERRDAQLAGDADPYPTF